VGRLIAALSAASTDADAVAAAGGVQA
jgi:hypothetical protein